MKHLFILSLVLFMYSCKSKMPYSVAVTFIDLEQVQAISGSTNASSITGRICKAENQDECINGDVTINVGTINRDFNNRNLILDLKANRSILPANPNSSSFVFTSNDCSVPLSFSSVERNGKLERFQLSSIMQEVTCNSTHNANVVNSSRGSIGGRGTDSPLTSPTSNSASGL